MTSTDVSKQIRVLLADDHAVVRTGIRTFLERSGDIEVVAEAGDGAEARDLIEQLLPDVAVLDIQMPGLTGIEVARQIRAHRLPVGILVLTAYEEDPYIAAVLKAGANGYVLKTASPQEIIQAVHDVFQGKSFLDEAILSKVMAQISQQVSLPFTNSLTDREMEILALIARGWTNKAIGNELSISDRTVQGHIAKIFEKLQVSSRTEAVMKAVASGLISADLIQANQ